MRSSKNPSCLCSGLNFAFSAYRSQKLKLFSLCSQPDSLPDLRQVAFQVEIKRQKEKKKKMFILELASGVFFRFQKSEIWKSGYVLCERQD